MANRYASILTNPLAAVILASDTPPTKSPRMFTLVDTTNNQAIARHRSRRALQALHYIQFANVDAVLVTEGQNKGWAQLEAPALLRVLGNANYTGEIPRAYNDLLKAVRTHVESCTWLVLPFTAEDLDKQAYALSPNDGRPMRFTPDAEHPQLMQSWAFEPQRFVPRVGSTFALEFSAGTAGVVNQLPLPLTSGRGNVQVPIKGSHSQEDHSMVTAKKAAAKKAPAKKTAAKKAPVAPKAPKAPKAPAAPKAAKAGKTKGDASVNAPREGGTTRKVWDVCEALLTKKGTCPPFSAVYAKLGDTISVATQRSTYAYWRRAKGFTGRVVE